MSFDTLELFFASEGDLLALVRMVILIAKRFRISGENKFNLISRVRSPVRDFCGLFDAATLLNRRSKKSAAFLCCGLHVLRGSND